MVFSVLASEIIFLILVQLKGVSIDVFWYIVAAVIPASISYPVTYLHNRLYKEIEVQRIELERLNLLNQELFSTISHDIRSPLTGITLLLEMIKTNRFDLKDIDALFDELSLSIDHIVRFLDELLEWSKSQIDKKPLIPELIETKPLIESTCLLYQRVILMKELDLQIDSISEFMMADKGSYLFSLRNVLQNSIKFTPKGGSIHINVSTSNGDVITTIKDSGIGISKAKIERILSRTDYESSSGTNNEKGVGFGLQASISYLKKQNGRLQIESDENKGTEVSIILPKH